MADDLATLSLKLENTQMVAAAGQAEAALNRMGGSGITAARNITLAASPVEQAILRQVTAAKQAAGGFFTMEQAVEAETHAALLAARGLDQVSTAAKAGSSHISAWAALQSSAAGHVGEHSLSLGRLERSLGRVTEEVFGLNPQITLLAESFGKFALGSIEMVAILAALAAIAYAWDKLTESSRKAKEEHEKFLKSTGELANAADAAKINTSARNLLYGTPFDEKGNLVANSARVAGAFKGSLADMEASLAGLQDKFKTAGNLLEKSAISQQINRLVKQLEEPRNKFRELQEAANNLLSQPSGTPGQIGPSVSKAQSDQAVLDEVTKRYVANFKAQRDAATEAARAFQEWQKSHPTDPSFFVDRQAAEAKEKARQLAEDQFYKGIDLEIAATKKADEEKLASTKHMLDEMRRGFSTFFDDILNHGVSSFGRLVGSVRTLFAKLIADLAARNLTESLGSYIGTAATSTAAATKAGGSVLGGIGAFASANPYLAAGIGIAAVGATILGAGASARAAAEQMKQLRAALELTLADLRVMAGLPGAEHAQRIAQINAAYDAARKQAEAAYPTGLTGDPGTDEQRRKNATILAQKLKEIEDLRLGALAKEKAAIDGVNSSMLNMVAGYKFLQSTIFTVAGPRAGPASAGSSAGGGGDLHVTVAVDGATLGKTVLKDFKRRSQLTSGDSTKWATIQ